MKQRTLAVLFSTNVQYFRNGLIGFLNNIAKKLMPSSDLN